MRFNYDRLPEEDAEEQQQQQQSSAPIEMEPLNGSLAPPADDQQVPAPAHVPADAPAVVPTVEAIEAAAPPPAPAVAEPAPPKYEDDTTPPPTYGNAVYGAPVAELYFDNDELLIEGLTVGTWFTFLCTMCGSWLFGVIGFLACFIFSTSHAGRDGAWAGFSLVIMQLSYYVREVVLYFYEYSENLGDDAPVDLEDDESLMTFYVFLSYALLLIAWTTLARSVLHYCHIRRAHAAIMAAATAAVAAPRTAV